MEVGRTLPDKVVWHPDIRPARCPGCSLCPVVEISSGWRRLFRIPLVYDLAQRAVSKKDFWPDILEEFLPPLVSHYQVLDIGCGPGTFLKRGYLGLNQGNFCGIDPSPDYIRAARNTFPRARFFQGTTESVPLKQEQFNLIVLSGVLHHLDDVEAASVLRFAELHLSVGGVMLSADPVTFRDQHPIARWMALADRGQNVRPPESMESLWKSNLALSQFGTTIKSGYLRVPYNHIICVARKDPSLARGQLAGR